MKFTIAAGILTQTLSALSETVSSSKLLLQQGHQDANSARILSRAINQPKRQQRPRQGRRRNRRNLVSTPLGSVKDCDPLSNDPDVGILSCDVGYECVISQASTLGGVCTSTSRELQDSPCLVCGEGYGSSRDNFENVLTMTIDGFDGTTCGDLNTAAYSENSTLVASDSACPSFIEAANASGCCDSFCYVCAEFQYASFYDIVEVPGFPDGTSCYDIYEATFYTDISAKSCPDVTAAAEAGGCCYDVSSYVVDCSLCGDGTLYPDALATEGGTVTCAELQYVLNATTCAVSAAKYAPICCASSELPVVVPSAAPVASPTEAPATPQSSDSTTIWSTAAVLSVMGLAIATAAGTVDLI
jgi:hypothetical protein